MVGSTTRTAETPFRDPTGAVGGCPGSVGVLNDEDRFGDLIEDAARTLHVGLREPEGCGSTAAANSSMVEVLKVAWPGPGSMLPKGISFQADRIYVGCHRRASSRVSRLELLPNMLRMYFEWAVGKSEKERVCLRRPCDSHCRSVLLNRVKR